MGYRKVYRTVDEQTTKKMVKMLQRHGIMAYGKSEGAGEILQITTGIPYQGRVVYVKEEQAEEAKNGLPTGRKKGNFLSRSEHSPIRQKQECSSDLGYYYCYGDFIQHRVQYVPVNKREVLQNGRFSGNRNRRKNLLYS